MGDFIISVFLIENACTLRTMKYLGNNKFRFQKLKISLIRMTPPSNSECCHILAEHKLPSRDIRMIMKESEPRGRYYLPVLMLRPSLNCFIFDMECIKFICFKDKCIIFNLKDIAAHKFIGDLEKKFMGTMRNSGVESKDEKMDDMNTLDFEHAILELALEHVTQKFKKHIEVIRPALDFFLEQVELNPESNGLRKLLAVKKYLTQFLQNVQHVIKVLQYIYDRDEEMIGLYLSQIRNKEELKEMELLLNTYTVLLEGVVSELKISLEMIETTDQFVNAHLDSIRNGLIKMSLFMDMGCVVFAFGAFVTGLFGMNLSNSLEEYPYAFLTVALILGAGMITIFAWMVRTYGLVLVNNSGHHSFRDLDETFNYVNDLDYQVPIKRDEKIKFKKVDAYGSFNTLEELYEILS